MAITRRSLIKATVAAGVGGAVAGVTESDARGRGRGRGRGRRVSTTNSATGPFGYTPFTATFGLPEVHNNALVDPDRGTIHSGIELDPGPGTIDCEVGSEIVYHGCAPETHRDHPVHVAANSNESPELRWDRFDNGVGQGGSENHYLMSIERSTHEFIPGIQTEIFGYASAAQSADYDVRGTGVFPGPTVLARHGQPAVMRVQNNLGEQGDLHSPECSVHLHGGHTPAHSDGFPDFYVLPGCKRDCFYPNTGPRSGAHPAAPGANAQEIAEAGSLGPF